MDSYYLVNYLDWTIFPALLGIDNPLWAALNPKGRGKISIGRLCHIFLKQKIYMELLPLFII